MLSIADFFGAYFHEDWDLEATSVTEVVGHYKATEKPSQEELDTLARSIITYAAAFPSDEDLQKRLAEDLGCSYLPSADGVSAHRWLMSIAQELKGE